MREELAAVRESYDTASREHAALSGKLNNEGRDDSMALARQALEGLRVKAATAADRYLVASLSVRLLDRARERFERERQPEVVRTAGRVFSAMTDGRYTDVRVPLDGSGVSVVTADGTIRTTEELSRGTAEQLYLALRVGLIGSLEGDRHVASGAHGRRRRELRPGAPSGSRRRGGGALGHAAGAVLHVPSRDC